jgi:hypothetical protein
MAQVDGEVGLVFMVLRGTASKWSTFANQDFGQSGWVRRWLRSVITFSPSIAMASPFARLCLVLFGNAHDSLACLLLSGRNVSIADVTVLGLRASSLYMIFTLAVLVK